MSFGIGRLGAGFSRLGSLRHHGLPIWLPVASGVAPTIFADFTTEGATNHYWYNGKQYAGFAAWNTALGGTYTRASAAGYTQSGIQKSALSNAARFPTDINGVPSGIRLTGAGTNVLLQSNAFGTTPWSFNNASAAQNVTGPDGVANSGWTLTATGTSFAEALQSISVGGTSSNYFFAKAMTSGFAYIQNQDVTGVVQTWFNLNTGAVGTVNRTVSGSPVIAQSGAAIQALGNGWYRCSVSVAGSNNLIAFGISDADAGTSVTVGNTANIFGAQITATAFPLDYIPTTTGTATQAADSFSFPYTATIGAVIISAQAAAAPFFLSDTGVGSSIPIYAPTASTVRTSDGTLLQQSLASGSWVTARHKGGVTGNVSGRSIASDGSAVTTDTNALYGNTPSLFYLNGGGASLGMGYGDYASLAIWKGLRISDADLQRLTT